MAHKCAGYCSKYLPCDNWFHPHSSPVRQVLLLSSFYRGGYSTESLSASSRLHNSKWWSVPLDSGRLVPESVFQPLHYAILSLFPTNTDGGNERKDWSWDGAERHGFCFSTNHPGETDRRVPFLALTCLLTFSN